MMKNYIAFFKQAGEGCDYTIGCGQTMVALEAKDIEAARVEVKQTIEDTGREEIKYVTIYEVASSETPDIDKLFAEDDAKEEADGKAWRESEEKRVLAELKKKYPDS